MEHNSTETINASSKQMLLIGEAYLLGKAACQKDMTNALVHEAQATRRFRPALIFVVASNATPFLNVETRGLPV